MPVPTGVIILRQQKVEDELIERIKAQPTGGRDKYHSIPRKALDGAEIRAAERLAEYGKISLRCPNMDCYNYIHRGIAKRFRERGFILEKRKYVSRVHYYLIPFPPKEEQGATS